MQYSHKHYYRLVDESGFRAELIFHIASQAESRELRDFLEDEILREDACEKIFGEPWAPRDPDELIDTLFEHDKIGFLMLVQVPERSMFSVDDEGEITSCSVNYGILTELVVYGDTWDELFQNAIAAADAERKRQFELWKSKQAA